MAQYPENWPEPLRIEAARQVRWTTCTVIDVVGVNELGVVFNEANRPGLIPLFRVLAGICMEPMHASRLRTWDYEGVATDGECIWGISAPLTFTPAPVHLLAIKDADLHMLRRAIEKFTAFVDDRMG